MAVLMPSREAPPTSPSYSAEAQEASMLSRPRNCQHTQNPPRVASIHQKDSRAAAKCCWMSVSCWHEFPWPCELISPTQPAFAVGRQLGQEPWEFNKLVRPILKLWVSHRGTTLTGVAISFFGSTDPLNAVLHNHGEAQLLLHTPRRYLHLVGARAPRQFAEQSTKTG